MRRVARVAEGSCVPQDVRSADGSAGREKRINTSTARIREAHGATEHGAGPAALPRLNRAGTPLVPRLTLHDTL